MPSKIPLDAYGTVTLNASGQGSVIVGPAKFNESWEVSTVSLNVSTNTLEPVAKVYRDIISQTTLIGGSYSGSFDADNAFNFTVYSGRKLVVQWTDGDPGAIATVRLYGEAVFK